MPRFYNDAPERAPRTPNLACVMVFCLLFTVVDILSLLFITVPCLRNFYARQNNVDYECYILQTQVTALQQQNAEMEKALRILTQDVEIPTNITLGNEYVPPKE